MPFPAAPWGGVEGAEDVSREKGAGKGSNSGPPSRSVLDGGERGTTRWWLLLNLHLCQDCSAQKQIVSTDIRSFPRVNAKKKKKKKKVRLP